MEIIRETKYRIINCSHAIHRRVFKHNEKSGSHGMAVSESLFGWCSTHIELYFCSCERNVASKHHSDSTTVYKYIVMFQ